MTIMGFLLLLGIALTIRWSGTRYEVWEPVEESPSGAGSARPSARRVAIRYSRGVAVALVGGFWAGALATGPAVRLIMRLLAVTASDDAQGKLT